MNRLSALRPGMLRSAIRWKGAVALLCFGLLLWLSETTPASAFERPVVVTTAHGVAPANALHVVGGSASADELLRNAGVAMYVCKHGGKRRLGVYGEDAPAVPERRYAVPA